MCVKCMGLDNAVMFEALPSATVAKVELCSIMYLKWGLCRGYKSWLMLLHPTSHVASTCAGVKGSEECATSAPSCWLKLINEYSDILEPPGMPAEHDIVHKIEL